MGEFKSSLMAGMGMALGSAVVSYVTYITLDSKIKEQQETIQSLRTTQEKEESYASLIRID